MDRLRACGLPTAGHHYVCIVTESGGQDTGLSVLQETGRTHAALLVGALEGGTQACALIAARPRTTQPSLSAEIKARLTEAASRGALAGAALSKTETDVTRLARNMSESRAALSFARRGEVIQTESVALERLLQHVSDHPEVRNFVDDQLGSLLAMDSRTGSQLVPTIEALVRTGSKTSAAMALNIRRQSLYYRLDRASTTLGLDLDDARQLATLAVALVGRRVLERRE